MGNRLKMNSLISKFLLLGRGQVCQKVSSAVTASPLSKLVGHPITTPALSATHLPDKSIQCRHKHFDHHFPNKWVKRDFYRKKLLKKHGHERMGYVLLKRSDILPKELKDAAEDDLQSRFPRDSNWTRAHHRCIVTGRGKWCVHRYRFSRIQWRLFTDYNKLAGWTRAVWGP